MKRKKSGLLVMLFGLALILGMIPAKNVEVYAVERTYTVSFSSQGNTETFENITLPHTFSCDWQENLDYSVTLDGELDRIIMSLYNFGWGYCWQNSPTVTGSTAVTAGLRGKKQYITVNSDFNGTAKVSGLYADGSGPIDYSLDITCSEYSSETVTEYPLWIGGTRVTEDALSGANWNFTPAEGESLAKLTLNGVNITAGYETLDTTWKTSTKGIYYNGKSPLIIDLAEDSINTIENVDNGIWSNRNSADVIITGTGELITSGKEYGIYSGWNLMIEGAVVNASGVDDGDSYVGGIWSGNILSLKDSTVSASATGRIAKGIRAHVIDIEDSIANVSANAQEGAAIADAYNTTIKNSTVNAIGTGVSGVSSSIVKIDSGNVNVSSTDRAIYGNVKNSIAGTGWENTEGTEGKIDIEVSAEGQELSHKNVQFPAVHSHDSIIFQPWANNNRLPSTAGNYYLTQDVTISDTWNVPDGTNLCLNGHGVKQIGNKDVVCVNDKLKLYDCDTMTEHRYFISEPVINGAGLATVDDSLESGYKTFTGGYITCACEDGCQGAGLYVSSTGSLVMNGGTIIGNQGTSGISGGGIKSENGSAITLRNVSIIGNKVNNAGGGLCIGGVATLIDCQIRSNYASKTSGGVNIQEGNYEKIFLKGCNVVNNYSANSNSQTFSSGGITARDCQLTMEGGCIVGNISNNNALSPGLILQKIGDKGNVTLKGAISIDGNKLGSIEDDSVGIYANRYINVDDLKTDNPIQIKMLNGVGVFTNSSDTMHNDPSLFSSYNTSYIVGKNTDKQLLLGVPITVSFDAQGHGIAPRSQAVAAGGTVAEPEGIAADGYIFGGWYKEAECINAWNFETDTVTDDRTLYAKWTAVPADVPSISGSKGAELTYGYVVGSTEVTASAPEGYTLNYQWYSCRIDGTGGVAIDPAAEPTATTAAYTIPLGKKAGTTDYYYCIVRSTRNDNEQTATAKSDVVTVKVGKAEPIATVPAVTAKRGQTLADIKLNNPEGNTDGTWTFVDPGTTSVGSVGSNTFKAKFTPLDTDNYNSVTNVNVTVNVCKANNPATVADTAEVERGGNIVDLSQNVELNGAKGTISYEISGDAKGCSINRGKLTSGDISGKVTVNVKVTEDDDYNESEIMVIIVAITGKDTQIITADDVTVSYGNMNKKVEAITSGDGSIRYEVKEGSEGYVDIDAITGVLTFKRIGTAVVVVTAAETSVYKEAKKEVTVTITKANPTVTAPKARNLNYTGKDWLLVTAGKSNGGTMQYAIGRSASTAPENGWGTSVPTGANAGIYYVWYKVKGDEIYNDSKPACVKTTITKKAKVKRKQSVGKTTIRNTTANTKNKTKSILYDAVPGATGYDIAYKHKNSSKWVVKSVGKTTRATISELSIGGLYEIKVRAKKAETTDYKAATGVWSATIYRYFHTTAKISLNSVAKGSFTMSWKKNPQASGYQVMFSTNKNGAGASKNINTVGKNATSFTKAGLKSGKTYYVQVRELKKVGNVTYVGNISCLVAVKIK